jgi:hypothetical protein
LCTGNPTARSIASQQLLSERDTVTIEGRSESLRVADILPQA